MPPIRSLIVVAILGIVLAAAVGVGSAQPQLADPSYGTLSLLTTTPQQQQQLDFVDGLAFDRHWNLLAVLEIAGAAGAAVFIDITTGDVTPLVSGISRADQIALHPSGDLFVTSEVAPASNTNRVYRLHVGYDANDRPVAGATTATPLVTSIAINNPEGLVVLPSAGAFGQLGDLYVCEDVFGGRVLHVDPSDGTTRVLASGLSRPEGIAFGDFGGATTPALFVAETINHRVLRIEADGMWSVVGTPTGVALQSPDNVEFGPDGYLYVTEDRSAPNSRIIRIAPDGTHTVFATGFGQAQGMIFDPATTALHVGEQDFDRVWRIVFATVPVQQTTFSDLKQSYRAP